MRYRLVGDHDMKLAPACKDDCVYQKIGADEGYYCFGYGDLLSECIEKEYGKGFFYISFRSDYFQLLQRN